MTRFGRTGWGISPPSDTVVATVPVGRVVNLVPPPLTAEPRDDGFTIPPVPAEGGTVSPNTQKSRGSEESGAVG
jgi:hypothetical protein